MAGNPLDTLVNGVLEALSHYPLVEGAVAIIVAIVGLRAINAGRKDGPVAPSPAHEYPSWLMAAPVVNLMERLHNMEDHNEHQVKLLEEIRDSNRRIVQVLEMIQNENIINPRRLQE
jgi:hypothetical protein